MTLICSNVAADEKAEAVAGWVSVLMAMKAAVDYGVDLRNHDCDRTWYHGFVNN